MTNREAIEVVKLAQAQVEWEYPMDYAAAFDMAISALQAQEAKNSKESSSTHKALDTISRTAAIDALCSVCGADCDKGEFVYGGKQEDEVILCPEHYALTQLPSVQPETAKRIVGRSRNGMTLWYQCDICNEPVDAQDIFCRGCGRRLTDG